MPIYKGSQKQKEVYFGGKKIKEIYKGSTLVYRSIVFTEIVLEFTKDLLYMSQSIPVEKGSTYRVKVLSSNPDDGKMDMVNGSDWANAIEDMATNKEYSFIAQDATIVFWSEVDREATIILGKENV